MTISARYLRPHRGSPPVARGPGGPPLEGYNLREGQWCLIASAQNDEPLSIRPFDAITFDLGIYV